MRVKSDEEMSVIHAPLLIKSNIMNNRQQALTWWNTLNDIEKKSIANQIKPDWTFEMFSASTSYIEMAYNRQLKEEQKQQKESDNHQTRIEKLFD